MSQKNRSAYDCWIAARRHALGDEVSLDLQTSLRLMRDAADLGISEGEPDYAFQLGRNLLTGIYYSDREDEHGVPPCSELPLDEGEAETWLRRAVQSGDPRAQHWAYLKDRQDLEKIGLLKLMAREGHPDIELTEQPWLIAACRMDDAASCMQLSYIFYKRTKEYLGNWGSRVEFYRKGRELGASHQPVVSYHLRDSSKSFDLALKQARAGFLPAQYDVGVRFAGDEAPDLVEAYAWLKAAFWNPNLAAEAQVARKAQVLEMKRTVDSTIWFLDRVLDEHELSLAKSRAEQYASEFPVRKINQLTRVEWTFDHLREWIRRQVER